MLFGDWQIGFEGTAYRSSDVNQIGGIDATIKVEVGEYRVTRHGRRNGIHVDLVYFSIADGIHEEAVEVEAGFEKPIGIRIQLKGA